MTGRSSSRWRGRSGRGVSTRCSHIALALPRDGRGRPALFGTGLEGAAIGVSICGGTLAVFGATLAARRAFDPGLGWLVGITVLSIPGPSTPRAT